MSVALGHPSVRNALIISATPATIIISPTNITVAAVAMTTLPSAIIPSTT